MAISDQPPSKDHISVSKLTITLLIAAVCSQLPFAGMIPMGMALFAVGDFMNAGPPETKSPGELIFLYGLWFVALIILAAGPVFLGLYFKPGWHGFRNGTLAFVAMAGGLLVGWLLRDLLQAANLVYLSYGVSASLLITTLLVLSGKIRSKRDLAGLVAAIIVGLALSFRFGLISGRSLWSWSFSAPFLWIWLSSVFFPDLFSNRAGWRAGVVYISTMIISTSIIFLAYRM